MQFAPGVTQPVSRCGVFFASCILIAAVTWLISRVWLGVDFTDEMQYYGEITGLVHTGRFFQEDLFLQQLGYLFVFPFFKAHALFFPDQNYLVVFGRLLLLAAYSATGVRFWMAATKLGRFSLSDKLVGLAALFAWVPFQIFAFSYNTTTYLLIVTLIAGWITRNPASSRRYAITTALLLTVLTYTHPTAGLALIVLATLETAWALGAITATLLLATTAVFGICVFGIMLALNGSNFIHDLIEAINFSGAFHAGQMLKSPTQVACTLGLIGMGGIFVRHHKVAWVFNHIMGMWHKSALNKTLFVAMVLAGVVALQPMLDWQIGYLTVVINLLLMLIIAACLACFRPQSVIRRLLQLILLAGGTTLLVRGLGWETGNYATALFWIILIVVTTTSLGEDDLVLSGLVVTGTLTGTVFAVTSSNGTSSFGVGAAAVIPFTVLYASRIITVAPSKIWPSLFQHALLPLLVGSLLINGILNPYAEQQIINRFQRVEGVPAFAGLWTSPVKIEAVKFFQQAVGLHGLASRRVLIIGPQPWLYFVVGGEPYTPMFFMHYTGGNIAYKIVAAHLLQRGPPDTIIITNIIMPSAIADQLDAWLKSGRDLQVFDTPQDVFRSLQQQVAAPFSSKIYLMTGHKTIE